VAVILAGGFESWRETTLRERTRGSNNPFPTSTQATPHTNNKSCCCCCPVRNPLPSPLPYSVPLPLTTMVLKDRSHRLAPTSSAHAHMLVDSIVLAGTVHSHGASRRNSLKEHENHIPFSSTSILTSTSSHQQQLHQRIQSSRYETLDFHTLDMMCS
jgi:hypothetical protein